MEFFAGLALGWLFWPILVAELLLLMWCIEDERPWLSVISMVTFGVLSYVFFGINLLSLIASNVLFVPVMLIVYVAIGIGYTFVRWKLKWREWRNKYDDATTDEERERLGSTTPRLIKNKGRVMMWLSYWPVSAMHWFLWDMFRELYRMVYRRIRDILLGIGRKELQGTMHEKKEID